MQGDDPPSGWKGLNNELENDLPDLNLCSAFISFDSLLCLLISLLSCLPSPLSLFLSPLFSYFSDASLKATYQQELVLKQNKSTRISRNYG
jgi:hypothetical protein